MNIIFIYICVFFNLFYYYHYYYPYPYYYYYNYFFNKWDKQIKKKKMSDKNKNNSSSKKDTFFTFISNKVKSSFLWKKQFQMITLSFYNSVSLYIKN